MDITVQQNHPKPSKTWIRWKVGRTISKFAGEARGRHKNATFHHGRTKSKTEKNFLCFGWPMANGKKNLLNDNTKPGLHKHKNAAISAIPKMNYCNPLTAPLSKLQPQQKSKKKHTHPPNFHHSPWKMVASWKTILSFLFGLPGNFSGAFAVKLQGYSIWTGATARVWKKFPSTNRILKWGWWFP